jgi:hypothetical protein
MFLRLITATLALVSLCTADTLTLRSGRVIKGQYLGGDARHIRMAVGDRVDTFNVEDIGDLEFGGDARQSTAAEPPPAQLPPPAPEAPPVVGIQIPAETPITVRMIDAVDSKHSHLGQTFRASVDEAVALNGQIVIPRGADALVKLIADQPSGKFEGKTILTLALVGITINGQSMDTAAGDVAKASKSRGARTAVVVGGGAVFGAIIGALAGGGAGAAIGAAAGAAVGVGAEVITKGQRVKVPSEARLNFTLQQPIQF